MLLFFFFLNAFLAGLNGWCYVELGHHWWNMTMAIVSGAVAVWDLFLWRDA